jgi:hypothetical protein
MQSLLSRLPGEDREGKMDIIDKRRGRVCNKEERKGATDDN